MRSISLLISIVLLTGCAPRGIGSRFLECDSVKYNQAINESVDSQTLLNIVRLRYRDNPSFLGVSTVTSAYESKKAAGSDFRIDGIGRMVSGVINPRLALEHTEKPTTIFNPLKGEHFVREMLSPTDLETILLLHSSGWKIDRILRLCVQRINKINNASSASGPTPLHSPEFREFRELVSILRDLELQDAFSIVKTKSGQSGNIEYYIHLDTERGSYSLLGRLWSILGVQQGTDQIKLVAYHGQRHRENEVVLDTRSPVSMMYYLSHAVQVPLQDERAGLVTHTKGANGAPFNWSELLEGMMVVNSGSTCHKVPAVRVCYRNHLFYIDDNDLDSKATFSMLSQILALQSGCPNLQPVITLPIN